MHGEHDRSLLPRLTMTLLHAAAVAVAGWILLGSGLEALDAWLPLPDTRAAPLRRMLLFGAAVVYLLRFVVTSFVLLRRKVGWSEAFTVAPWLFIIHITFALLGGTAPGEPGWGAAVAIVLYVVGSYLNTASEYQRSRWKARAENRGRLYTEGLFRYSMHINYFGDVALFTGYALLTARVVSLVIPAIMAAGFVFMHIPMLDRYLAERYPREFEDYRKRTAKLVPFLY